jgi:5-methylcytosine-specific restriction endonuclease McrA
MSIDKKRYGKDWNLIANKVKAEAQYKCEECGRPNSLKKGERLTVHHKDGNPENNARYNLEALCTRCHLGKHKFLQAKYQYTQKEEQGQLNISTGIKQTPR